MKNVIQEQSWIKLINCKVFKRCVTNRFSMSLKREPVLLYSKLCISVKKKVLVHHPLRAQVKFTKQVLVNCTNTLKNNWPKRLYGQNAKHYVLYAIKRCSFKRIVIKINILVAHEIAKNNIVGLVYEKIGSLWVYKF